MNNEMYMNMNLKRIYNAMFYVVLIVFALGCQSPTITDDIDDHIDDQIDDKIEYDSTDIIIGNQIWMSRNLERDLFRNGDTIFLAKNIDEWKLAGEEKKPACCDYNFDSINGSKYGKLYNWYAVYDSRGLAPKGYHIAYDHEWKELSEYLGGDTKAGKKILGTLFGGENGNNFNALPGGGNFYDAFKYIDTCAFWWTSTPHTTTMSWIRKVDKNRSNLDKISSEKVLGFSVRCIRNKQQENE